MYCFSIYSCVLVDCDIDYLSHDIYLTIDIILGGGMGSRKHKKNILLLLENKTLPDIINQLSAYREKDVVNPLFSALCSTNERIKWHAVSCFGFVVSRIAEQDFESARIIMRRFLWSLNDESGGIGWGAPESLSEIMAQNDNLFHEYIHMLISYMRLDGPEILQDGNYLELPALQQGLLWGIGRLLMCRSEEMLPKGITKDLERYLDSSDKIVQGLAAWCLGMCYDVEDADKLIPLTKITIQFNLYLEGSFNQVNMAELVLNSIKAIKKNKQKKHESET